MHACARRMQHQDPGAQTWASSKILEVENTAKFSKTLLKCLRNIQKSCRILPCGPPWCHDHLAYKAGGARQRKADQDAERLHAQHWICFPPDFPASATDISFNMIERLLAVS